MLLHDWLVILTAQYNDACKLVQYDQGSSTAARIDIALSQCPQLQPLPRLVFALLRNPLLRFHEEGVHPDYRIYLQCLFRYTNFHSHWLCIHQPEFLCSFGNNTRDEIHFPLWFVKPYVHTKTTFLATIIHESQLKLHITFPFVSYKPI